MKHYRILASALVLTAAATLGAENLTELTQAQCNNIYKSESKGRISVHDPSVVHAGGATFYVIGSHRGWARSTDNMVNWTGLNNANLFGRLNSNGTAVACDYADAFSSNATTTVRALVDGTAQDVAFGPFDAKAWANADQVGWDISGNMWAPDLIYNPHSQKWMMYMSINGDAWHSVIVLLTADRITGPYVYQGPVHYSGFINGTNPAISWKKTDLEIVLGKQNTLPSRYNKGSDWGTWWTNDIDPCVFFDEQGELWMTYGSWSGGIFIIRLDKQTGLRDYTYTYPTETDGNGRALSDPYFGRRIAGGYYSSGEGSYIQHIGDYYYLFMSYGGFAPDGGYEMRLFRSETPDGQYVDANGLDACFHNRAWVTVGPGAQTNGGMKLLGAYNGWGFQTVGECAQGHNSATADDKGRNFVVYHTKFNDGTAGHQVRTRQLFLNADGWPVAAPFEFHGEAVNDDSIAAGCHFAKEQLPGTYQVLIHRYKLDHENMEEVTPISITLGTDGRISGDLTGTWTLTAGTAHISLKAGSTTYKGVVVPQTVDGTTLKAVGITAQAKSGVSLWAFKLEDASAVAYNVKTYAMPVRNSQNVNRHLPLAAYNPVYGATVTWTSSNPDVIDSEGRYNPAADDTKLTLTCRIQAGNTYYEQAFNVNALKAGELTGDARSAIVAYYDFETKPQANAYDGGQTAFFGHVGNVTPTAAIEADAERYGNVLHLWGGAAKAESFTRMPNPLEGAVAEGFTIATWVRLDADANLGATLWSVTDKAGNLTTVKERFYLTANGTLAFATATDNFTANALNVNASGVPTNATGYIPLGEWTHVVVTASADDGVTLYVNGLKRAHKTFASSAGTANNAINAAKLFDYTKLLNAVSAAAYVQYGSGGTGGSAAACYDDLLIYSRSLTATDVRTLYQLTGRVTDFGPNGQVGIGSIAVGGTGSNRAADSRCFDLAGRRLSQPRRGLNIVGGRKVVAR
ncbi:MAG: family 43 glycosylhydrolase [Bacteroidaceae bacterium]|nr:family 43 glycosylhydrolase [Bacteroidaceae bacterium]